MRALLCASMAALIGVGLGVCAVPPTAEAQAFIGVSVRFAPPALPVYEQPPIPAYGYIWTPGYWAWSDYDNDYYWVPGCWVEPPAPRLLWTPGYWSWDQGLYIFNAGYWGPHIGFYGGVDYGFGYTGYGYQGGYWNGDRFYYNRYVNNVSSARITTIYNTAVVSRGAVDNASYNGGPGGVRVRATPRELLAARETHAPPTAGQLQQRHLASTLPGLRASINHGKPPIAATPRPAMMRGPGVVAASRAAPFHPSPAGAIRAGPRMTARLAPGAGPVARIAARTPAAVIRNGVAARRAPSYGAVRPSYRAVRMGQRPSGHTAARAPMRPYAAVRQRGYSPARGPAFSRPVARSYQPGRPRAFAAPRSFAPARMAAPRAFAPSRMGPPARMAAPRMAPPARMAAPPRPAPSAAPRGGGGRQGPRR